jgi:hypothetical protein
MRPSTFLYMLRWCMPHVICGIGLTILSYFMITFPGDPPGLPIQSLADMVLNPVGWISLTAGLLMLLRGYVQASDATVRSHAIGGANFMFPALALSSLAVILMFSWFF